MLGDWEGSGICCSLLIRVRKSGVVGCRPFLTLKNGGEKDGGSSGHRPSTFPEGD